MCAVVSCFEVASTLCEKNHKKYELVTAISKVAAVVISDGTTAVDESIGSSAEWEYRGGAHAVKADREQHFPANLSMMP